jgi:hypothetical protein
MGSSSIANRTSPMEFGVALTVAFFAFFWALCGKLNVMGVEYAQWNRTSPVFLVRAVALGLAAGAVMAWWFRNYGLGTEPLSPNCGLPSRGDRLKG